MLSHLIRCGGHLYSSACRARQKREMQGKSKEEQAREIQKTQSGMFILFWFFIGLALLMMFWPLFVGFLVISFIVFLIMH